MESSKQQLEAEVRAYFATPVLFVELENAEKLNENLREIILSRREKEMGEADKSAYSWYSGWDFASWGGESSQMLLETFASVGHDITQVRSDNDNSPSKEIPWSLSARAVVNPSGKDNLLHAHPNCFWSGVYYVDDGGINEDISAAGQLELFDPRGPGPAMYNSAVRMNVPGGENAGGYHHIKPKSGLMVVFPSWLLHGVTPYRGKGLRISIAINLFLGQ